MCEYLISIIIFSIVIKASLSIAKGFLEDKGRLEKIKIYNKNNKSKPSIVITACVPVFRLLVVVSIFYLCFCDDERFEKILRKD